MRILRAAGVALVFAAIGPVAGLAQFYVLFVVGSSSPPFGRVGSDLWWEVMTVGLAGGLVPAVVAGITSGAMAVSGQPRGRIWFITLLAGALASAALGFALTGSAILPLVFAVAGTLAAAVCQAVVEGGRALLRWAGRDRS